MGNCIKKQAAFKSEGHEWGSPVSAPETKLLAGRHRDKGQKRDDNSGDNSTGDKTAITEVKIKISKKQLEELLGRTDVQGLTVQQVLAQLMDASDEFESHQRSWRPALESIPE